MGIEDTENAIDIASLDRPILAIVRLKSEKKELRDAHGVLTPYYQVTIDRENISPSGDFIRFGGTNGDEITGWRPLDDIVIEETIGQYAEGSEPPKLAVQQSGIQLVPFVAMERVS